MNKVVYLFLFVFLSLYASAQESPAKKSNPVKFSGGLSLSSNAYSNGGVGRNRQSPFSYAISGAPTLTIYNISFPFSFTFSDQQFSYSHPFNRYGVSPNYKWIKLHLGYRSMNFSDYTVAGRQFLGAGIELTPGKFHFSALTGKLEDPYAQRDSLVFGATTLDTYTRRIHSVKIGVGKTSGFDIIALKVKDEIDSATPQEADNVRLVPKDNLVLGLNFRLLLFKRLQFKVESAGSLHTNDARATINADSLDLPQAYYTLNKIIKTNISTRWGTAGKAQVNLNLKPFTIGFGYQRVDPNFMSMGVYYMVTDFENYTANFSTRLFKKQLRLKLKGGYQQNNLSLLRRSTNLRKIGNVQINYANPKGFTASLNINNMQTDQRAGYVEIEDTLRLALSNSSAIFNTGYGWKQGKTRQSISLNIGRTNFKDINPLYFTAIGETINNNAGISYSLKHKPSSMSYSIGINYYELNSSYNNSSGIGFNAGIGKKLLNKKLSIRFNTSLNQRKLDGEKDGYYLRLRNRMTYKVTKSQRLSFYISWAKRPSISKTPLNETRASISYGLNF